MRTVQTTVQAQYECDVCQAQSALTAGLLPAGWKEIRQREMPALSPVTIKKHICPACFASSDPVVLAAIKDLIS